MPAADPRAAGKDQRSPGVWGEPPEPTLMENVTDGMGTPDPDPKILLSWRVLYDSVDLTFV